MVSIAKMSKPRSLFSDLKSRRYISIFPILISLVLVLIYSLFSDELSVIKHKRRTLVLYCFMEKTTIFSHATSLQYFLELGVSAEDPVDYVFIIQGFISPGVAIPEHYPNVRVLRRPNTCFDYGAFGAAINWLGGLDAIERKYDHFIFLNPTALGPILPKFWPENRHWSEIFTSRLKYNVHAVSVNMICVPEYAGHGWGPMLEGKKTKLNSGQGLF
jgi:hypothetical protein